MNKTLQTIFSIVTLASIIISGLLVTNYLSHKIKTDEVSNLLLRSEMAALAIDKVETSVLSGTLQDEALPAFASTTRTLRSIRAINTDTRFVYLMGQQADKQFFMADAEQKDSPDYSPAGQIYTEATQSDKDNFRLKKPFTKGPYTDRWGTWFTAYAPVLTSNSSSSPEFIYIGLDINAEKVLLRERIVYLASLLIFGLLFLATLSTLAFIRKSMFIK